MLRRAGGGNELSPNHLSISTATLLCKHSQKIKQRSGTKPLSQLSIITAVFSSVGKCGLSSAQLARSSAEWRSPLPCPDPNNAGGELDAADRGGSGESGRRPTRPPEEFGPLDFERRAASQRGCGTGKLGNWERGNWGPGGGQLGGVEETGGLS